MKEFAVHIRINSENYKSIYGESIDELIECLQELKDEDFVRAFLKSYKGLSQKQKSTVEKLILEMNCCQLFFDYLSIYNKFVNIAKFEEKIKQYPAEDILRFAIKTKNRRVANLEDVFLSKTVDARQLVEFAEKVEGATITKFEDKLDELNPMPRIYADFAIRVKGADIDKMQEKIIISKDLDTIVRFAILVPDANALRLARTVVNQEQIPYILALMGKISSITEEQIKQMVEDTGDKKFIKQFNKELKKMKS